MKNYKNAVIIGAFAAAAVAFTVNYYLVGVGCIAVGLILWSTVGRKRRHRPLR